MDKQFSFVLGCILFFSSNGTFGSECKTSDIQEVVGKRRSFSVEEIDKNSKFKLKSASEALIDLDYVIKAEAFKSYSRAKDFWGMAGIELSDLIQEGRTQFLQKWEQYDPTRSNPKTFTNTVVTSHFNSLISFYGREKRTALILVDFDVSVLAKGNSADLDQVDLPDELNHLREKVSHLKPGNAHLLKLYFEDDLTFDEIGMRFGKTKAWAHITIKKTLEKLRSTLADE